MVVADQRTAIDWHVVKHLVDVHYPDAEQIVLVAERFADKLEIHYTPKHGSWLNMAETELSVLGRQCLDRHIPDRDTLVSETTAWMHDRNADQATIDWRFTTNDAASNSSASTRRSDHDNPLGPTFAWR